MHFWCFAGGEICRAVNFFFFFPIELSLILLKVAIKICLIVEQRKKNQEEKQKKKNRSMRVAIKNVADERIIETRLRLLDRNFANSKNESEIISAQKIK